MLIKVCQNFPVCLLLQLIELVNGHFNLFAILCFRLELRRPPDVISGGRYSFYTFEQLLLFFKILNEVQFHWR